MSSALGVQSGVRRPERAASLPLPRAAPNNNRDEYDHPCELNPWHRQIVIIR
jgi:hypothetical protein